MRLIKRKLNLIDSQRGFSLIELMIAIVLGLFLVLGVLSIFVSSQRSSAVVSDLSRMQDASRSSFESISRDVRMVGANLCGSKNMANVVINPSSIWNIDFEGGTIRGFDGNTSPGQDDPMELLTTGIRATNTDAIALMLIDESNSLKVLSHDESTNEFTMTGTVNPFSVGNFVISCDYKGASIFEVTDAASSPAVTIKHDAIIGSPGNCSSGLKYPSDCLQANGNKRKFDSGGFVSNIASSIWYVGANTRGGSSIFRTDGARTEEIAENISNMQVEYLLQDRLTETIDSDWLDADAVTDWSNGSAKRIIALRITFEMSNPAVVAGTGSAVSRSTTHVISLRNSQI